MTSPPPDVWTVPAIVHVLRDATRAAHERLDANSPVFDDTLDLRDYHLLLGRYLMAHRAVEVALEPWSAALAPMGVLLDERAKVPLLLRDRAATASRLGRGGEDVEQLRISLPTLASAWGALYVAEGSTLGGQHILRTLRSSELTRRESLTADEGLAYFTGYGSRTGEMWRQFLSALGEGDASASGERDAIVGGARCTFVLFDRALSRSGESPKHR